MWVAGWVGGGKCDKLDSKKNDNNQRPANPPKVGVGIHHGGLAGNPFTLKFTAHALKLIECLPTHPTVAKLIMLNKESQNRSSVSW